MTDIGFCFGFWIFRIWINNLLDGFLGYWRLINNQSTSGTKVYRPQLPYKSTIALFFGYGNYLKDRRNTNNGKEKIRIIDSLEQGKNKGRIEIQPRVKSNIL